MPEKKHTNISSVTYPVPTKVKNDYAGFVFFTKAFEILKELKDQTITFDFSRTDWFEANLVAVFSSLVETLRMKRCQVKVLNVSKTIVTIFKKNGFYGYYNLGIEDDVYNSTIPFKIFSVDDSEGFTKYLDDEVIPKIKLPLTLDQTRYFKKCLQEIFENANMHAYSKCVYTCGQYYHQKQKVAFTIVDIGNTIGKNVRRKIPGIIDCDAIDWATQFGNTTKIDKDGGIGLNFLKDHLSLDNNGKLQIISGNGYWEQNQDNIFIRKLTYTFDGTIVNLVSDLDINVAKKTDEIKF